MAEAGDDCTDQGTPHGIFHKNREANRSGPFTIRFVYKKKYWKMHMTECMNFIDVVFVHKANREMLEWADALCWYEPETISADELKKLGNTAFGKRKFEGNFLVKKSPFIDKFP